MSGFVLELRYGKPVAPEPKPITNRPIQCDVADLASMSADEMHEFLVAKYGPDYETKEF